MRRPRHLVHVFSTFEPGGPQVRTADIIRDLPDGFEHSILAMDGAYGCRQRVDAGRVRAWLTLDGLKRGAFFALRIADYLIAREPDLILTYNWGAIDTVIGCRLRRFGRVVHHEEGFGPDERTGQKRRRIWARRMFLPSTRAVVVPSRSLEKVALSIWKLPQRLVAYIANGVDVDHFAPGDRAAARAAFGFDPDAVVIGTVGHLRGEKNHALLIDSFAQLPDAGAQLLIAGDGPERARLTARAEGLGVAGRIHFAGTVADPRPVLDAIDVFTLSSATEQMPLSLLEAMAMGKAVVATDVGDCAAMVSRPNRDFVVAATDYARALHRVAGRPELRAKLGAANLEHCRRDFPQAKTVATYQDLYERAIAGMMEP